MKRVIKLSSFVIVLALFLVLTACAPKSALSAYRKLAKKDYEVSMRFGDKTDSKYDPTISVSGVKEYKSGNSDRVYAALYSNVEAAKLAYEIYVDELAKENKDSTKVSDMIVKRSGKWVVYGTQQGVKDFL